MRPVHCSLFRAITAAFIAAMAVSTPAAAGRIILTASASQVDLACINAGGTSTAGIGPGGYGCKTNKGEVTCNKDGKCVGECEKCGAARVVQGGLKGRLGQILTNLRSAGATRDHRTKPVVRDHRTKPVVRDHRSPPVKLKFP